ncbi:MAG: HAMP domain-containing protein [Pseudorhodobacter sp.]|nr:HAMP domain-containing protein [Pseudorhodobacter sp.]
MPLVETYLASADRSISLALTDKAESDANYQKFLDDFQRLEVNMGDLGTSIQGNGNTISQNAVIDNERLIQVALGASAIAALILVISNILIARSITKPLARVKNAMKEVAAGNLGGRFSEFGRVSDLRDEVSEIARYLEELRIRLRVAVEMEASLQQQRDQQQIVVAALGTALENLSAGDLSQPISTPFAAEYEDLRSNFNRAVDRMNQTISQIVQTSRSIRARADDISTGSEEMSRRTESQAATLEETAAALDELTASTKSAAAGAREVETIVQNARREAEDSGKVVANAVEAMTGIERSSDQISQIIGVIDDIAFQTNLLALNAGVEAARAGGAGRGFAVVASEVRALAQRSSHASKEIKSLISASAQFVGRGVDAVGGAGRALTLLVDRVSNIATLVSGIATGAAEQSTALAEVNVGVTQLDQVAQRNAAMVEQSSNATAALQDEAIGLDKLVSQFTTQAEPAPRPKKDRAVRAAA